MWGSVVSQVLSKSIDQIAGMKDVISNDWFPNCDQDFSKPIDNAKFLAVRMRTCLQKGGAQKEDLLQLVRLGRSVASSPIFKEVLGESHYTTLETNCTRSNAIKDAIDALFSEMSADLKPKADLIAKIIASGVMTVKWSNITLGQHDAVVTGVEEMFKDFDKEAAEEIVQFAGDIGDDLLQRQARIAIQSIELLQASVGVMRKATAKTQDERRLTSHENISAFRRKLTTATQIATALEQEEALTASEMHTIKNLDGIDINKLAQVAVAQATWAHNHAASVWSADISKLISTINEWCPAGWQVYAGTLLDQPDIVKSLLTNPHYPNIGPICEVLKEWQKIVKAVHKADDRVLCGSDVVQTMKTTLTLGISTITTTFIVFQVKHVLTKITNQTKLADAIDALRANVKAKGGTICESVENALADLVKETE